MTTVAMSYWSADTSEPVLETTVGGILRAAAAAAPEMTAMVAGVPDPGGRRRWTYAGLLAEAERAARALAARFAPGERVAVWAPNMPEWVILEFAAGLAGLVLVTVNPALRPAELAFVLNQSGAAGIFLIPEFRSPMAQFLDEVRPGVPALREVVFFTDWQEFLAGAPDGAVLPEVCPDDIAQIQYTSGTTGSPKGAELHHRGLTNNARFFAARMGMRPGDVYVNPMPLFHTSGCAMGVLGVTQTLGVHVPVLAFEPGLVLELLETERGTLFGGVPTMIIAMLGHPDFERRDLSSLRAAVSGGSPVPAGLVRQVEDRLGLRFSIVFGTTECSPLITQVTPDASAQDRAETLGTPLPQTEVMPRRGRSRNTSSGRALPRTSPGDHLTAQLAAGGLVEAVRGQPVPDPRAVGVGLGHHVVDVVQAPRGGLVLQVLQDESAHAPAAPAGRDHEGDARVAPLGVQPAVAGHLPVVGHPPPFVRDRLAGPGRGQAHRGQLGRAENPLLVRVPAG
jgi:fatty-acyl-CoA synthase